MGIGHVVKWIFYYFTENAIMKVRIGVIYKGKVQGVGFRWQVSKIAENFNCTGYVKNLGDGTVELLVEGVADEACFMVEAIDSKMRGYWTQKTENKRDGDPHYNDFTICY
jgi:acylphosphatase